MIVFLAINFIIMKLTNPYKKISHQKSDGLIAKYSFYGSLIFFLLSSPELYKLTNSIIGSTSDFNGCPSETGLYVHTVAYILILLGVMYFPKK
jgi:hypothetical protein